ALPHTASQSALPAPGAARNPSRLGAGIVAATMLIAVGSASVYLLTRGGNRSGAGHSAAEARAVETLAVLPFANESKDPEAEHLGDEIPGSIIKSLSALRNLKVRPLSSASRCYHGRETDLQEVGRQPNSRSGPT